MTSKNLGSWTGRIAISISLIAVGAFVFSFVNEMWYQASLGNGMQAEFGFEIGSPWIDDGTGSGAEPIEIVSLTPDSPLVKAGVSLGDYIADDLTIAQFYKLLELSRSEPVTIRFVAGGDGLPINKRATKSVTVDTRKLKIDG